MVKYLSGTNRCKLFCMDRSTGSDSYRFLEVTECKPTIVLQKGKKRESFNAFHNNGNFYTYNLSKIEVEATNSIRVSMLKHTWSIANNTGMSLTRDSSFLKRTTTPTEACVWVIPVWMRSYNVDPSGISIVSAPFIIPTPAPSPRGIGSKIWHGNCCKRVSLYFKKS